MMPLDRALLLSLAPCQRHIEEPALSRALPPMPVIQTPPLRVNPALPLWHAIVSTGIHESDGPRLSRSLSVRGRPEPIDGSSRGYLSVAYP